MGFKLTTKETVATKKNEDPTLVRTNGIARLVGLAKAKVDARK